MDSSWKKKKTKKKKKKKKKKNKQKKNKKQKQKKQYLIRIFFSYHGYVPFSSLTMQWYLVSKISQNYLSYYIDT